MKRRGFLGLLGATIVSPPNLSFAQTAPSPRATPLRIVVVANTYYEGDGLMTVLSNRWVI
jgi:hypothetical protein